jgi:hypothetical protein
MEHPLKISNHQVRKEEELKSMITTVEGEQPATTKSILSALN